MKLYAAPTQRSAGAIACRSNRFRHACGSRLATPSRHRLPPPKASRSGDGAGGSGGVLVLPGFFLSSQQYTAMLADLQAEGYDADVVPVATSDWFPVLYGASFEWYLQRMDEKLRAMHARHGRVALLGHSAGGWLARILLGEESYQGLRYRRNDMVHTLLTLGTPHRSTENYPFGRVEESLQGPNLAAAPAGVRGSSLQFANYFSPDAASLGGVRVVTACGNSIRGRPLFGSSAASDGSSTGSGGGSTSAAGSSSSGGGGSQATNGSATAGGTMEAIGMGSLDEGSDFGRGLETRAGNKWDAYMAYEGYKSGCGRGDVDGDGVTPLCIAMLPGAEQLVLPGVWHVPRRGKGQPWYGDKAVQHMWLQYLREPQGSSLGRV